MQLQFVYYVIYRSKDNLCETEEENLIQIKKILQQQAQFIVKPKPTFPHVSKYWEYNIIRWL